MKLFDRFKNTAVNKEYADDLVAQTQRQVDKMEPINIIVAGKTGSGKSTLINALFRDNIAETGVGKPVTQSIERISKEGIPLTLYDTKGLELTPEAQVEVLKSLNNLIKTQKDKGQRESIDVAYYCINSIMARIEPFEIELIEALSEHIPVVIVLTQYLGQESNEFVNYLKEMDLPVKGIVPVLAKPYLIQGEQYIPSHGLQDLVDLSLKIIPDSVQKAFINAQQIDLDRKVKDARSWARRYIRGSFGVGFTPIPIADSAILIPMQIGMLAHITSIFGLSLNKSQIVSIIAGIGGTGGATAAGKYIVSQVFKLIPGLGTITGGVVSGTTASVLTMTLAYSYIDVLKFIAQAEISGRDLPLVEIQKTMNLSFKEQLDYFSDFFPDSVKDTILNEWSNQFLK